MDKFAALSDVVSAKRMFGGWVIHFAGKVLGFIFDGRFLFEPGPTIDRLLPEAERVELFPGSKLFVVIEDSISPSRLCEISRACYDDFPVSKPHRSKRGADKKKKTGADTTDGKPVFPFEKHIL